jgi:hypothetical protein
MPSKCCEELQMLASLFHCFLGSFPKLHHTLLLHPRGTSVKEIQRNQHFWHSILYPMFQFGEIRAAPAGLQNISTRSFLFALRQTDRNNLQDTQMLRKVATQTSRPTAARTSGFCCLLLAARRSSLSNYMVASTTAQLTATCHSFQLYPDQIEHISMQTKSIDCLSHAKTPRHHHPPPVPTMLRYPVPPLHPRMKSRHSTIK